jgi:Zn-dependent protease
MNHPSLPNLPPRNDLPSLQPGLAAQPPPEAPWWKKAFAPVFAVLALGAKFFGAIKLFLLPAFKWLGVFKFAGLLKFIPLLLKTGGSMILSIGVYAMFWGWKFALGFVVLLFVHELGHVFAARWMKLDVSAPVFIPFIGAHILMRDMPKNAWIEAIVGIGGPVLGTVGAIVCHNIYVFTQEPIWLALAYSAYFLNLFNLIPLSPLDGGRICAALSPWLWLVGLFVIAWLIISRDFMSPVMILILIAAAPQIWSLFWSKTPEQQAYYTVPAGRRIVMGLCYFGLAGFLFFEMHESMDALQALKHWRHM